MSDETTDQEIDDRSDDDLVPMTLETVADGQLESQFQERLHEALGDLRGHRRCEPDSDGTISSVIKLEVVITFDPGDGSYQHAARAFHPKKPRPRAVEADAFRRGDELKVMPGMVQETIPGIE